MGFWHVLATREASLCPCVGGTRLTQSAREGEAGELLPLVPMRVSVACYLLGLPPLRSHPTPSSPTRPRRSTLRSSDPCLAWFSSASQAGRRSPPLAWCSCLNGLCCARPCTACSLQEALDRERDKHRQWRDENVRRKHNYVPLLFNALKLMAERGQLAGIIAEARKQPLPKS